MKILSIWGHTERPWGYEVRAELQDTEGNIFSEVLAFPEAPTQIEIDAAVAERQTLVSTRSELTQSQGQEVQVAPISAQIEASKEVIKMVVMEFILLHPAASFLDMQEYVTTTYGWQEGMLASRLVYDYATVAKSMGLITIPANTPEEMYISLRQFVVDTPLEQIKALLGVV